MKRVNLIPAHRRDAKRRRLHVRACIAGAGLYAVVVIVGSVGFYTSSTPGNVNAAESPSSLDERVQRLTVSVATARSEVTASKKALEMNRKISSQPDWSRLMVVLAGQTGDNIMLKSCAIGGKTDAAVAPVPVVTVASPARAVSQRHDTVSIAGVADSQFSVSQFILRLEHTHLFSNVTAIDSRRENAQDGGTVAFRLQCSLEVDK